MKRRVNSPEVPCGNARAGLRIGDWLKDYDGKPFRTRDDFLSAVEAAQGKPEVKLTVESEGKARVVKLRSGKLGLWLTGR